MFAKIFKNSIVINQEVPNIIRCNFPVYEGLSSEDDIDKIFDTLVRSEEDNAETDRVAFFQIPEYMINPVIKKFCFHMSLPYHVYEIMVEQYYMYLISCIRPYEPEYKDIKFSLVPERTWSMNYQNIPWNYGILPIEYWVNHYGYDEYATHLYDTMYDEYTKEESIRSKTGKCSNLSFKGEFIHSPKYNGCFNDEFTIPLFNKRLVLYLMKIKFILLGMKSGIDPKELNKLDNGGKKYDSEYFN